MNKKWIILGLLVCLFVVAAYLIFSGKNPEPPPIKNIVAQPPPSPPVTPTPAASAEVPPSHRLPPVPAVPPGVTVPPNVAKDPTALAYFLADMTPISFYGKVIDEKGAPIEGATTKIGVSDKAFQDGSTYIKTSDAAGLFSIIGVHGMGLGVTVSKDGYYRLPESSKVYGYAEGVSSDSPKPTPDSPAVFVLRKKGVGVQLIHKGLRGNLFKDGRPVDINLETGQIVAPNSGNFRIVVSAPNQGQNANMPFDWQYQISAPGGGLTERKGNLDFEAPSDGYQVADQDSATAKSPRLAGLDRQYFVKLSDNRYARLSLSVTVGQDNFFTLIADINPTPGDRNLEAASQ